MLSAGVVFCSRLIGSIGLEALAQADSKKLAKTITLTINFFTKRTPLQQQPPSKNKTPYASR
jgi:hypothetical protein